MVVPPAMVEVDGVNPGGGEKDKWVGELKLFELECWSVLQNLVPNMWHLVFAKVPI